jgi:hypothetical protein
MHTIQLATSSNQPSDQNTTSQKLPWLEPNIDLAKLGVQPRLAFFFTFPSL